MTERIHPNLEIADSPMLKSLPRPSIPPVVLLGSTLSVVLAYIFAVLIRPTTPDWKKAQDPHEYGFPRWYTGAIPSPYDPNPATATRGPLNITFVIDLPSSSTPSPLTPAESPSFPSALHTLSTLRSRPDVYISTEEDGCPHIYWKVSDGSERAWRERIMEVKASCPDTVVVSDVPGMSRSPREVGEGADITLVPNPQDLLSQAEYGRLKENAGEGWRMGLMAHVLPGAEWVVLVLANDSFRTYSPRTEKVIREFTYFPYLDTSAKEWPGFEAYNVARRIAPPTVMRDDLGTKSRLVRAWKKNELAQASGMARAGVCLFEGWDKGVLDVRMAQAMLSGCLVAMVPPNVEHTELTNLIIPLKSTEDVVPTAQIEEALARLSDSEIKRLLLNAFIYARQVFAEEVRIDSVLDVYDRYIEGARGYMFPHQYKWTCQSDGERPPWCPS